MIENTAWKQKYTFEQVDICDFNEVKQLFSRYQPTAVMHLAAESHVDRSIDDPSDFITTNIIGTFNLLEAARWYYRSLDGSSQKYFRFHHVSTDEVYGDLKGEDGLFVETTPYAPSSPYSATKAGSDHLVRAWGRTFGLPILVTNCSNNYGPYHFPEKLIPLCILKALQGQDLPIYGDGQQIRDWLYVVDHCKGITTVLEKGVVGETYNIGGFNEWKNIDLVKLLCQQMDEKL